MLDIDNRHTGEFLLVGAQHAAPLPDKASTTSVFSAFNF
jgi:hypothetical protein